MAKSETKKSAGRPRIEIDLSLLKALGAVQCTIEEICQGLIAAGVNLDVRTLKRRLMEPRYRSVWEGGKAEGRVSLRRLQWRHARMPNSAGVQMTIHLSKHVLGETDKSLVELAGRVDSTVEVTSARDRVNRKLDAIAERIARRVDRLAVAAGAGTRAPEAV